MTGRRRRAPPIVLEKPTPPLDRERLARIRAVEATPGPLRRPKNYLFALHAMVGYMSRAPPWLAKALGRVRPYPRPFRRVSFPSWDGTMLTAWLGVHRDAKGKPLPRHGILLVPGIFNTKDNAMHRDRAHRFFTEWGYHVLALDLRGMGESSRVYNTLGWKEAEDVESAVEYVRARVPLEKLHVYSESMGAVAAILACAHVAERGFRLVDGGVLAVSPFPDALRVVRRLSRARMEDETLAIVRWFFQRLLLLSGQSYTSFRAYLRDSAKSYGVTVEELLARSSMKRSLKRVNVPLLIVCADDDPLVPKTEVARMARLLRGSQNPALLRLSWGSHCLFELLDPRWYWSLLQEFFDFHCLLPPRSTKRRRTKPLSRARA